MLCFSLTIDLMTVFLFIYVLYNLSFAQNYYVQQIDLLNCTDMIKSGYDLTAYNLTNITVK